THEPHEHGLAMQTRQLQPGVDPRSWLPVIADHPGIVLALLLTAALAALVRYLYRHSEKYAMIVAVRTCKDERQLEALIRLAEVWANRQPPRGKEPTTTAPTGQRRRTLRLR